ncbi:hypothetical protein PG994_002993 [Apiospora phragmitis]|uniref:F-box domain-containing protein n=1 Tax=Apiospora phragmitis TaxID=2905665 RepID=A0ABR1W6S7_9PEZI
MPGLLTIPDELLLLIQGNLVTRKDRFAFGVTCKYLYGKVGGTFLYEQDVAEERDFDEARLRLERFSAEQPGFDEVQSLHLEQFPEAIIARLARAEAMAAVPATVHSEEEKAAIGEKTKETARFLENCVGRWGPRMLLFTKYRLQVEIQLTWRQHNTNLVETLHPDHPLPDSQ